MKSMLQIRLRATILRLLVGAAAVCVGLLWPTLLLAHDSAQVADQLLITEEIRYHTNEAGEVALLWGIDGWAPLPEALRPAGTVMQKNAMSTPMMRAGDAFVASVRVPRGATIDYLFHITKAPSGVVVDAWEGNGAPNQDYHTLAQEDGTVDVQSRVSLAEQTFFSPNDIELQWSGVLALLGAALLLGVVIVLRTRDPYLS